MNLMDANSKTKLEVESSVQFVKMLRNIVVLATACLYLVAAHKQADVHTADKAFLAKQKDLYSLFWHVDQPTTVNADLYQVARSWSIEEHIDSYVNQTVVHDFVLRYKHGLLHRGAVFSTFHHEHLEEAVALFKLFWYAKDYETFYNTAVWARFNVNEKLFTYALAVAIIHRPDTKYIHLPPLHEIMPHFFFNNEVIQAAYYAEGFNILANIIEGNADSINVHFYGSIDHLCRKILGFGLSPIDKHHIHPSALEYYVTSLRDPAFWRIYKKIVTYFLKYKEHLPTYTHEELTFPGVKIDSVAVDKLLTYFEHYDSEISNGVPVSTHKDAETTSIKVRQHRLNHKPFTYHITVNSDKNVKAVVRVFLGPKFDHHGHEIDFVDNWVNFIELDQWVVDLKSGINKIERSSHESMYVVPDEPSGVLYWKKLVKAIETGEAFTYSSQVYGFPDRLILPKGKREGLPLKLFVFISEFDENHVVKVDSPVWGTTVVDAKPMGYPLDKPVVAHSFHVPNAYFKDVVVFHKHVEELNLTV